MVVENYYHLEGFTPELLVVNQER